MTEDRSHETEPAPENEPAPGAEHGETSVDPDADTSHGTGAAPEHVDDDDVDRPDER